MGGYDRSPDYGGRAWKLRDMVLIGLAMIALVAFYVSGLPRAQTPTEARAPSTQETPAVGP